MDRYPEAFKKSAMFKGETLGFPLRAHPQLMFYRKDLFTKHGISEPKTWSDVVSAGKMIKAKEGIGGLACYFGADGNNPSPHFDMPRSTRGTRSDARGWRPGRGGGPVLGVMAYVCHVSCPSRHSPV